MKGRLTHCCASADGTFLRYWKAAREQSDGFRILQAARPHIFGLQRHLLHVLGDSARLDVLTAFDGPDGGLLACAR